VDPDIHIRKATFDDIPRLRAIIEASVRGLQASDYSPAQIEGALQSVYGLIASLLPTERISSRKFSRLGEIQKSLPAVAGANVELYMAETSSPPVRIPFLIPPTMRRRFAHSSCIRSGRGEELAA
jgi:hypothetical protein